MKALQSMRNFCPVRTSCLILITIVLALLITIAADAKNRDGAKKANQVKPKVALVVAKKPKKCIEGRDG